MKKLQVMIMGIGLLLTSACTQAQESGEIAVIKTTDGKLVTPERLDSLKKIYPDGFQYQHVQDQPGVVYMIPKSSAAMKAAAESKARFAELIGKPAPNFQLTDINGNKYDLEKLKGKVVVLNFWFTTCGGCIAEMPFLNKMKQGYKNGQVVFLGLALEKTGQIREFQKTHQFNFALIPETMSTAETFGIYGYPVSMVIDRQGLITTIIESDQPIEKLPVAIDAALKSLSN